MTQASVSSTSIQELQELWLMLFPGIEQPSLAQWARWHLMHSPQIVRLGISELAARYQKPPAMTPEHMLKFASSAMNRETAKVPHRKAAR